MHDVVAHKILHTYRELSPNAQFCSILLLLMLGPPIIGHIYHARCSSTYDVGGRQPGSISDTCKCGYVLFVMCTIPSIRILRKGALGFQGPGQPNCSTPSELGLLPPSLKECNFRFFRNQQLHV